MKKSIFGHYTLSIPPLEKSFVLARLSCALQHFRTFGSVIGQGEIVLPILQKDSSLTPIKVAESHLQLSLFFARSPSFHSTVFRPRHNLYPSFLP